MTQVEWDEILAELQALRLRELDLEHWFVEQHPLNAPRYNPLRPRPADSYCLFRDRQVLSQRLLAANGQAIRYPAKGQMGLWCVYHFPLMLIPVQFERAVQHEVGASTHYWHASRLDDPPDRRPYYRMGDVFDIRLLPA